MPLWLWPCSVTLPAWISPIRMLWDWRRGITSPRAEKWHHPCRAISSRCIGLLYVLLSVDVCGVSKCLWPSARMCSGVIEWTHDDNTSHRSSSVESNLETLGELMRERLRQTHPLHEYAHFYWITLTLWTNETSFIITEILIAPKYPAVYLLWLLMYLSSGWFRMGGKSQNRSGNGWGKQYRGTGLHYSTLLQQILNENPREAYRSLYLIRPL